MITVLTASLPERHAMLAEARASVETQTLPAAAHLVEVDANREGAAVVYNRLAEQATTEWVTFLDDDDLLDPNHLETLWAHQDETDIIYTGCRVESSTGYVYAGYDQMFSVPLLMHSSIVPITCLLRRDLFLELGGFRSEWGYDWRFWQRAARRHCTFHKIHATTWTYRLHGANQSVEGVA